MTIMKDQITSCKVSRFEDDVEDNKLFGKKQHMPLRSVENWAIHPTTIECDEEN